MYIYIYIYRERERKFDFFIYISCLKKRRLFTTTFKAICKHQIKYITIQFCKTLSKTFY